MKIVIEADLSPWELAQVIQKVRELDLTKPERELFIGVDAPEYNQAQQQAVFEFLDPPLEIVGLFRKYEEVDL